MTDDEIRGLLEKATPGKWAWDADRPIYALRASGVTIMDCGEDGILPIDADARLMAAAPEMAREVLRLRAELAQTDAGATELYREKCAEEDRAYRAESEVLRLTPLLADAERRIARLERVLAVERGDASAALEGWAWSGTSWRRGPLAAWRLLPGRWHWSTDHDGDTAPTALEAMEAADRAARDAK